MERNKTIAEVVSSLSTAPPATQIPTSTLTTPTTGQAPMPYRPPTVGNPNSGIFKPTPPAVKKDYEFNIQKSLIYDTDSKGNMVAKFENYKGNFGNENRLAEGQSGFEQAMNGVGKFFAKTTAYAVDSVVGTVYGIGQSIIEGDSDKLWDNDFSNMVDDINQQMDYALPNYYTDEQKSMNFLQSMGTANFWFNDVGNGLAFVAGALLPSAVMTVATGGASAPKLGFDIAKGLAKVGAKSTIKNGKDVYRAFNLAKHGAKAQDIAKTTLFLARTSNFEAGMEARQNFKQAVSTYISEFESKNGRQPTSEELSNFTQQARTAANGVYVANLGILSVSNSLMFGKILGAKSLALPKSKMGNAFLSAKGLGVTKSATGEITQKALTRGGKVRGTIYNVGKPLFTEGIYEEGLQGVVGTTMQNYLSAKYDPSNDNIDLMSNLTDAFAHQYGSKEGWKEMGIGMIIGILGGGIGKGNNSTGISPYKGFRESYSVQAKYDNITEAVDRSNKGRNDLMDAYNNANVLTNFKSEENDLGTESMKNSMDMLTYIKSQRHVFSKNSTQTNFDAIIDAQEFTEEQVDSLGGMENVQVYKEQQKEQFASVLGRYTKVSKAVSALGLDNLQLTRGDQENLRDSFETMFTIGLNGRDVAQGIGDKIDELTGQSGAYSALDLYATLSKQKSNSLRRYNTATKALAQAQSTLETALAVPTNATESQLAGLAEKRVLAQRRISELQAEIEEVTVDLNSFKRVKTFDAAGLAEEIVNEETVDTAIQKYNEIQDLIQGLEKQGNTEAASNLKYLLNQHDMYSQAYRESIKLANDMFATNFFNGKEGKGLVNRFLGDKFKIDDATRQMIKENDLEIARQLGGIGITIENIANIDNEVEMLINENESLSERDKHRIAALLRLNLSVEALNAKIDNFVEGVEAPKAPETAIPKGDTLRVRLNPTGETELEQLNSVINQINQELHRVRSADPSVNKFKDKLKKVADLTKEKRDLKSKKLTDAVSKRLSEIDNELEELDKVDLPNKNSRIEELKGIIAELEAEQMRLLEEEQTVNKKEVTAQVRTNSFGSQEAFIEEVIEGLTLDLATEQGEFGNPERAAEIQSKIDELRKNQNTKIENETKQTKAGNRLFNEPISEVTTIADQYYERVFGKQREKFEGTTELDVVKAKRISAAYEAMKHEPNNPKVKEAYAAMAKEVIDQYEAFIAAGYTVEINNNEPYANSAEMIEDLRTNRRIKIFSTESGFGDDAITDEQRAENPLLATTKFKDVNGQSMLVNDLFRAVHDFFGHAELGNSFGAKGEENAWNVHARMFSPLARQAITSETRGQNSWVNFSGVNDKLEALRTKARRLREEGASEQEVQKIIDEIYEIGSFADQKVGLLPEEFFTLDVAEETQQEENLELIRVQDELTKYNNELATIDPLSGIIESEDYKRFEDLTKKRMDKTINPYEQAEMEELGERIDEWQYLTGSVVAGHRLSDLVKTRIFLQNAKVAETPQVAIQTDTDTIASSQFSYTPKAANMDHGQTYDSATVKVYDKDKRFLEVNGISLEDFSRLAEVEEDELEVTPDGRNNVLVPTELADQLNKSGKVKLFPNNGNIKSSYSVVLGEKETPNGVKLQPIESTYRNAEEWNGQTMNPEAIYNMVNDDSVVFAFDVKDKFNQTLSTLEDYQNKGVIRIYTKDGDFVGVMKGITEFSTKSKKDRDIENFRKVIITKDLISAAKKAPQAIVLPQGTNVSIGTVLLGHVNFNYVLGVNGLETVSQPIIEKDLDNIVDIGYIQNGKAITKNGSSPRTTFFSKAINRKLDTKIPFIVVKKGNQNIALPVNLPEIPPVDSKEFTDVLGSSLSQIDKAITLNKMFMDEGYDVIKRDNAFRGYGESNLTMEKLEEMLAELNANQKYNSIDSWISQNVTIKDALAGANVNYDISNPVHSPKLRLDFKGIEGLKAVEEKSKKNNIVVNTITENKANKSVSSVKGREILTNGKSSGYYVVPTSSASMPGYYVIDNNLYEKWLTLDKEQARVAKQIDDSILGSEQRAKDHKANVMKLAAKKRQVLGVDASDEVAKMNKDKVQVGDSVTIADDTYQVTGFAFGYAMISLNQEKPKRITSFSNEDDIVNGILSAKKRKLNSLKKDGQVETYGFGQTIEEAVKVFDQQILKNTVTENTFDDNLVSEAFSNVTEGQNPLANKKFFDTLVAKAQQINSTKKMRLSELLRTLGDFVQKETGGVVSKQDIIDIGAEIEDVMKRTKLPKTVSNTLDKVFDKEEKNKPC